MSDFHIFRIYGNLLAESHSRGAIKLVIITAIIVFFIEVILSHMPGDESGRESQMGRIHPNAAL